jgi:hypothetical protein
VEADAARARRYEKALELIWVSPGAGPADIPRAKRDIAAVALGLRAPGTHLRGIVHLAPLKR